MKRQTKDVAFKKKGNKLKATIDNLYEDVKSLQLTVNDFEKNLDTIPEQFKQKISKDIEMLIEDPKSKEIDQDLKAISKFKELSEIKDAFEKIQDKITKRQLEFQTLINDSKEAGISPDLFTKEIEQSFENLNNSVASTLKAIEEIEANPANTAKIEMIKNCKTLSHMTKMHRSFLSINTACLDVNLKSTTFTPMRKLRTLIKEDVKKLEFNFDNFGLNSPKR